MKRNSRLHRLNLRASRIERHILRFQLRRRKIPAKLIEAEARVRAQIRKGRSRA